MVHRGTGTNVHEIGLDDGDVVPKEDRIIARYVQPVLAELREALAGAHVSGSKMGHRRDGSSINVHAKFTVIVGAEEMKFTVHAMKDGVWAPGSLPIILKFSKLESVIRSSKDAADKAFRFAALKPGGLDINGEKVRSPQERVTEFMKRSLSTEIADAESRLRAQALALLESPGAAAAARLCWESAMRIIVHGALEKVLGELSNIPPEAMHMFVDEMYAKQIHDS